MTIALVVTNPSEPSLSWMPPARFNSEIEAMNYASLDLWSALEQDGYNPYQLKIELINSERKSHHG